MALHASVISYDPRGEVNDVRYPVAPRMTRLEGMRLGILDNSKWNASKLLRGAEERLRIQFKPTSSKYYHTQFSLDADPRLLQTIATECDVVLTAIADCGSCTSCLIRDSVALEKLGVPVAAIVTTEFTREAEMTLGVLGMPSMRRVVIGHPVSSISLNEVVKRVDQICEQAPAVWLGR